MATKPTPITVAKYLEQQFAVTDLTQREVASLIGYDNPNIITMFKRGSTRVPLNKIGPLAKALKVDQVHLLRLAMSEYAPDTWAAIEEILGTQVQVTQGEMELVKMARESTAEVGIDLSIDENRKIIRKAFDTVAAKDAAKAEATLRRYNSLGGNAKQSNRLKAEA